MSIVRYQRMHVVDESRYDPNGTTYHALVVMDEALCTICGLRMAEHLAASHVCAPEQKESADG